MFCECFSKCSYEGFENDEKWIFFSNSGTNQDKACSISNVPTIPTYDSFIW